jgi:hypothetical protein
MFTLIQVNAAAPANSPFKVAAGAYAEGILLMAERKVKSICRRALETASYSDVGYTLACENPDGATVYAYYLREPTGTAIAFASLTAFTLNDDTVATADVTREATRLIFNSPGEVKVTYPGGYCRDTTGAAVVLLQAVIGTMHAIHKAMQESVKADYSTIEELLDPYTASLMSGGYAEGPE